MSTQSYPQQIRQSHPSLARLAAAGLTAGVAAIAATTAITEGSSPSSTPTVQQTAMVRPLSLNDRVLAPGALREFLRHDQVTVASGASAWATAERSAGVAEAQRLRGLGFLAGAEERFRAWYSRGAQARSLVEQYRSVAGARAELAYQYRRTLRTARASGQALTRFRVSGIRDAIGWEIRSPQTSEVDVVFTEGRFYYAVGAASPRGAHGAPTRQSLTGAAQSIYLTVNGCVARTAQAA